MPPLIFNGSRPMIRTYSELRLIPTFKERFEYLKLNGRVGEETFGFDRYFNQLFYRSKEWKDVRNFVIARDSGCDLAILDRAIFGKAFIHHMNPISIEDIKEATDYLLNPEFLITTSKLTHDAIHYGDSDLLIMEPIVRKPRDNILW